MDVTFIVYVPLNSEQVILVGSLQELGAWDVHRGIHLHPVNDDKFEVTLSLPIHQPIEYKFIRGDWDSEALYEKGGIPPNHQITLNGSDTLIHEIKAWKDRIDPTVDIAGHVVYHSDFYSPQLHNSRDIIVWLPPSYESNQERKFPVLYLHDGQNVFSSWTSFLGQEWYLDEIVTRLIDQGLIKEIIMVAIYNTDDRTVEYRPIWKGKLYEEFITQTLKPFIDTNYRTLKDRNNTAVMGSSLGGLISFDMVWDHPEVFSMAACLSPAFLVDNQEIIKRVKSTVKIEKAIKVVIMNGTEGIDIQLKPAVSKMSDILVTKGYQLGNDLLFQIVEGADHSEQAWSKQVMLPLLFFFGKKDVNFNYSPRRH